MDDAPLHARLHASEERNAALCGELASLRAAHDRMAAEFSALRRDYEALTDATGRTWRRPRFMGVRK